MRLDRLLAILEAISASGKPVTVAEIINTTGLPQATCHRLLRILESNGLIDSRDANSGYNIGDRLIRIALRGRPDGDVRKAAAPVLRKAAADINATTYLARFRHPVVETIHIETPPDQSAGHIYPGLNERPWHACACAKAIAAFAPRPFQNEIIAAPHIRFNERTKTTAEELRKEFVQIRRRGYAECDEEIEIGVVAVAAPVHIRQTGAMFSVAAVGPLSRFGPETRAEMGQWLIGLSGRLSAAIQLSSPANDASGGEPLDTTA